MKHLSSLQRKLALGRDMLRHVLSRARPHYPQSATLRTTGDWELSRQALADLQSSIEQMNLQESQASEGSAELYWRSKSNATERELMIAQLKMRETEYLGRAVNQIGQYFDSVLPADRTQSLNSCKLEEHVLVQHWARSADENLRLLEELLKVEQKLASIEEQVGKDDVAVENAQALVGLSQFEENFYRGRLFENAGIDNDLRLCLNSTPAAISELKSEIQRTEKSLAALSEDWRTVEGYLTTIFETESIQESKVRADLVSRCMAIGRKYINHGSRSPSIQ